MTKEEQKSFVTELSNTIAKSVLRDIESDSIPETWEGPELRRLLTDRFTSTSWLILSPKRKRAYENTKLINNL